MGNQWLRLGVGTPDMEDMDFDSVNFSDDVVVLIEQRGYALPVVLLAPVAHQFLAIAEWHALLPIFHGLGIREACLHQSLNGILDCRVVKPGFKVLDCAIHVLSLAKLRRPKVAVDTNGSHGCAQALSLSFNPL